MLRKIYYSEGRRIKEEGVEKEEKTRRYRRRKAGGALAKERKEITRGLFREKLFSRPLV
jgi:hypothetical protein